VRVLWRALRARAADGRSRTAPDARRRPLRGQPSDRVWGLQRPQGLAAPRGVPARRRCRTCALLPPRPAARVAEDPACCEEELRRPVSRSSTAQSKEHRLLHDLPIPQVLHDDPPPGARGSRPAYHTPSGYTTTIGPPVQTPRQGVSPRFHAPGPEEKALALEQAREQCVERSSLAIRRAEPADADEHVARVGLHERRELLRRESWHGAKSSAPDASSGVERGL
jgi:hypothetical protein